MCVCVSAATSFSMLDGQQSTTLCCRPRINKVAAVALHIIVANVNGNPQLNLQELLSHHGSFGAVATALNVH